MDRCLAGDWKAWERLFRQCQRPLAVAIRTFLGSRSANADLTDEIAARVWYVLVNQQGELLGRFDAARGCRLTTFLSAIAKRETMRYLRSEQRRRDRETQVARSARVGQRVQQPLAETEHVELLAGFLASLSPRERQFCQAELLGRSLDETSDLSQSNRWQLRHRVRRKLWAYLATT